MIAEVRDGVYKLRNILSGIRKTSFYIVYLDKEPMIIAPVEINKNTAMILGSAEYFDFVDIFYRSNAKYSILKECFIHLLIYLKQMGMSTLRWNYLPSDSFSKDYLSLFNVTENCEVDNVAILFKNYKEYIKSLSKSTRQNLRTAENRIKREGHDYRLLNNFNSPLDSDVVKQCEDVYYHRQKDNYGKNALNLFMIKTINYGTQLIKKQKGNLMVLMIDNKVAAFMFGFINDQKESFEVPKLAINDDYAFYSPGMILINKTIEYFDLNSDINKLDLCRGTELYKLKMGGHIYKTYNYTVEL